MKRYTLLFAVLLWIGTANAQDKLPSFGQIDKAELQIKDCDFDPGAEAVVLINVGEINFEHVQDIGWVSTADYRVRVKILKSNAVHRAEIKIAYYSYNRLQEISNVGGISYNLDDAGNIEQTKMEKSAIFFKSINKQLSEVSFALPNVKVGTVFEYKYTMTRRSYSIPDWTFQQSIPVKYSAYYIFIPDMFKYTMQTVKRQEMEKKDDKFRGTWYIMHNVPSLKNETYSSAKNDYLQRVEFQLTGIEASGIYHDIRTTWPKLIDDLLNDEDFGGAIKKNIKGTDDLDAQLAGAKTSKEKIRTVYKYVQSNMQWNKEYRFWVEGGTKSAWDRKNGSIAEINFILIRLLKDAGIPARAVIASTKDNGTINPILPFVNQFNCVFAYVVDGEDVYVMNAADKFNSFDQIPQEVLYTNALVVDREEGGLIQLNSAKKYSNSIFFNVVVDDNGKCTGEATISSAGYARNIRHSTYKNSKLKEMLEDNEGITIKVDSLSVNNEKDELAPLEQKIVFKGSAQASGEYLFLPYGLFTGLGKNPFVEENRVMDIDFNFPKSYVIVGSYVIPDNYVISELPKNTKMILPDTTIVLTRISQADGNVVSFRFTLDFNAPGYTAESYPYIKEFFKKLYDILDERIVVKKK